MATEKQLIWYEDAIKAVSEEYINGTPLTEREVSGILKNRRRLKALPTVDAVEVVRCKDCVWCHTFENLNYCENPKAPWIDDPDFDDITVAENDFCSYGERRTDG